MQNDEIPVPKAASEGPSQSGRLYLIPVLRGGHRQGSEKHSCHSCAISFAESFEVIALVTAAREGWPPPGVSVESLGARHDVVAVVAVDGRIEPVVRHPAQTPELVDRRGAQPPPIVLEVLIFAGTYLRRSLAPAPRWRSR
jgi:hypothetical protein